jgi:hypothetical protein
MNCHMTARRLLALLALAAACTPKTQEEYKVELVGALDQVYLMGATKAVLEVNGKQVASTSISPGSPFTLNGTGIDTTVTTSGVFRVKALDATGAVVAVGESPEIELELQTPPVVRIFMQRVSSFGRHFELDYPRRGMFAVAATATVSPDLMDSRAKPITVGFFGLGLATVPDMNNQLVEKPSEVVHIYNTVTQLVEEVGVGGEPSGTPHPRVDAGATVHSDGRVLVFGGEVTVPGMPATPSAQLDIVPIQRTDFDVFAPNVTPRETLDPAIPRIGPVMVYTDAAYAIGGRAGQPLDTIVVINPDMDIGFRLLPQHMAGPRERHTATVVNTSGGHDILIFGGASAGVDVAEVLAPPGPMLVKPAGNAGVPRRDHAALLLPPGDRVLILGGRNDNTVLGDTVLYQSDGRVLSAGPITLKRPRAEFAAFVVGDELVVAGGFDGTGALINSAEIYDANTLQPRNLDVPCVARADAAVVVLPNHLVLIMGGTELDMMKGMLKASSVVETYQPVPK